MHSERWTAIFICTVMFVAGIGLLFMSYDSIVKGDFLMFIMNIIGGSAFIGTSLLIFWKRQFGEWVVDRLKDFWRDNIKRDWPVHLPSMIVVFGNHDGHFHMYDGGNYVLRRHRIIRETEEFLQVLHKNFWLLPESDFFNKNIDMHLSRNAEWRLSSMLQPSHDHNAVLQHMLLLRDMQLYLDENSFSCLNDNCGFVDCNGINSEEILQKVYYRPLCVGLLPALPRKLRNQMMKVLEESFDIPVKFIREDYKLELVAKFNRL